MNACGTLLKHGIMLSTLFTFLIPGQAHGVEPCSLASLNGTYGFTLTGFRIIGSVRTPVAAPTASVGIITFDEEGNFTGAGTMSDKGIITQATFTGTATVNADCTGSLTVDMDKYDFVLDDNGREIRAILTTDEGAVITVEGKKQ